MRIATIAAVATMTASVPALGADTGSPEQIASFCAEKWPVDYRMQEHCRKRQAAAAEGVKIFVERLETDDKVLVLCLPKWPRDSTMRRHCISGQIEATQELRSLFIEAGGDEKKMTALGECLLKWPEDATMKAYCTNRQFDSIDRLSGN